jgi:tRNA dimethylallyltransferase
MSKNNLDLIVILGPTASGKTKLAVTLANAIDGEIISADSRQVYKGMDIGTGKDLSEYQNVPYHLIDICLAGEKYNVARFQSDFVEVLEEIKSRKKFPILCGGTGLYIQAALSDLWQIHIPVDENLRTAASKFSRNELEAKFEKYNTSLVFDISTNKRLIRAIEICDFLEKNSDFHVKEQTKLNFNIFGTNPELNVRRERISKRLKDRIENQGMIEEVKSLLVNGVGFETLEYYGLEYKYISYFLSGKMSNSEMFVKLETEIHRFAKRQMTFFRSLEKKGFVINWIPDSLNEAEKVNYILSNIN